MNVLILLRQNGTLFPPSSRQKSAFAKVSEFLEGNLEQQDTSHSVQRDQHRPPMQCVFRLPVQSSQRCMWYFYCFIWIIRNLTLQCKAIQTYSSLPAYNSVTSFRIAPFRFKQILKKKYGKIVCQHVQEALGRKKRSPRKDKKCDIPFQALVWANYHLHPILFRNKKKNTGETLRNWIVTFTFLGTCAHDLVKAAFFLPAPIKYNRTLVGRKAYFTVALSSTVL